VKHWLAFTLSSLFLLGQALMGQNGSSKSGAWAGVLISADCTADEAYAESAKCIEQPAAKLALYDDTLRRIYHLEPQGQAMGHLGEVVTVQGALRNDVIHVASLQVVTEIGLPIGRQAPAFFARDQFGHEQTLDTLRGSKGTVLLFVRSADW
jgi:hypothetical protein